MLELMIGMAFANVVLTLLVFFVRRANRRLAVALIVAVSAVATYLLAPKLAVTDRSLANEVLCAAVIVAIVWLPGAIVAMIRPSAERPVGPVLSAVALSAVLGLCSLVITIFIVAVVLGLDFSY